MGRALAELDAYVVERDLRQYAHKKNLHDTNPSFDLTSGSARTVVKRTAEDATDTPTTGASRRSPPMTSGVSFLSDCPLTMS